MSDCKPKGSRPKPASQTIVSMSLRLAIPWRVALQQSPPPLRQPETLWQRRSGLNNNNHLTAECRNPVCLNRGGHPTAVSRLVSTYVGRRDALTGGKRRQECRRGHECPRHIITPSLNQHNCRLLDCFRYCIQKRRCENA